MSRLVPTAAALLFAFAAGPAAAQHQVSKPSIYALWDWVAKPSDEEIQAAKPPGVQTRGYASLACDASDDGQLINCTPIVEAPRGQGFGQAAISLAPRFRITPQQARRLREAQAKLNLHLGWSGAGGPCLPPTCFAEGATPPPTAATPPPRGP